MTRPDPALIPADALYRVDVPCPACGEHADVLLTIAARLTKQKADAKLGVKCTQKAVDHRCSAVQLTIVAETGEIMHLDAGDS